MLSVKELKQTPEYWLENMQNNLYYFLKNYMEEKGLNQSEFANELGYSKGYVSQILSGEFNYSVKKFIELSLAIGFEPVLEFKKVDDLEVTEDINNCRVIDFVNYKNEKLTQSSNKLNVNAKGDLILEYG